MQTILRQKINQAKKDFPGCRICGPVKFDNSNRYYVRNAEGKQLDVIIEVL
jgi:hypothetical protein